MQFDKEDEAALLLADIVGDDASQDDEEDERARLASIQAAEVANKRPWHTTSTPQCSDEVRTLDLGPDLPALRFRAQPWPPHAGEIVATGGIVWDAALVLSKYLEVCAEEVRGYSAAVELGAGLGVPSLAASAAGVPCVIATDVPVRLPGIDRNIALNQTEGRILDTRPLDWGTRGGAELLALVRSAHPQHFPDTAFPLILCSDVLFCNEAIPPLVDVIASLSAPGTVVLSCCEHRWEGALAFYTQLADAGFDVQRVHADAQHHLYNHPSIHLYRSVKLEGKRQHHKQFMSEGLGADGGSGDGSEMPFVAGSSMALHDKYYSREHRQWMQEEEEKALSMAVVVAYHQLRATLTELRLMAAEALPHRERKPKKKRRSSLPSLGKRIQVRMQTAGAQVVRQYETMRQDGRLRMAKYDGVWRHVAATVRTTKRKFVSDVKRRVQASSAVQNASAILRQLQSTMTSDWNAMQPLYFPSEYAHHFKFWRREADINDLPVTRCEAFYPNHSPSEIEAIMCDTKERLAWDRNLADFRAVDEANDIYYHRIESSVLKKFGFKGREYLYKRIISDCDGVKCRNVLFTSVEDGEVAGTQRAPDSTAAEGEDGGSVRGFIHYQNYRMEEVEQDGDLGTRLTITAVVDARASPPRYVANLICRMMSGQPYVWMREHLSCMRGGRSALPQQVDPPAPTGWTTAPYDHYALLE